MINLIRGYDFDDVLIVPTISDVSSRDDVDISVKLTDDFVLNFPLIASPMVGVTDGKFAKKLSKAGGLAILHRFYKSKKKLFKNICKHLSKGDNFGLSIRIGETNIEDYLNFSPRILLIDTANGYTKRLRDYCLEVKEVIARYKPNTLLMAGNIVTPEGCEALYNAGCDIIRVGIGGGAVCSTRNQTGIGIPNITALQYCYSAPHKYLVIDGGIKNSGDFVKAISAGADFAMSGKLFAQCYEAPNKGVLYGMASRTHMEKSNVKIKSVEGIDITIEKKYSLKRFVREFGYGIKSAGTYLGAENLTEIFYKSNFIQVSDFSIKKGI